MEAGWPQIPLTPTLSRREREQQRLALEHSSRARFADSLRTILLLPSGEGRAEGDLNAQANGNGFSMLKLIISILLLGCC